MRLLHEKFYTYFFNKFGCADHGEISNWRYLTSERIALEVDVANEANQRVVSDDGEESSLSFSLHEPRREWRVSR